MSLGFLEGLSYTQYCSLHLFIHLIAFSCQNQAQNPDLFYYLNYYSFIIMLKIRQCLSMLNLPTLFFFKVVLAVLGPLTHMDFKISITISTKNPSGILIETVLNLQIHLERTDILAILSYPSYEYSYIFIQVTLKNFFTYFLN